MIDTSKYPKAALLRQQREEKYDAEQARQKAAMSIKPRQKTQQAECKAAEAKVAKKRKKP